VCEIEKAIAKFVDEGMRLTSAPRQYVALLAILSAADPWGLIFCGRSMTKVAILIDGIFIKRLPRVRKDVDSTEPEAVDHAIGQLVRSHPEQLNNTAGASSRWTLLYRCFYYHARPYMKKGHKPVSGQAIDHSKSPQAQFRLARKSADRT
jgi:hypothetical protein